VEILIKQFWRSSQSRTTVKEITGYGYIAHIDAIDETVAQWTTFAERFDHFVNANYIEQEKKVAALLSVMGAATYGHLHSRIAPDKPGGMTYEDIVDVLQGHFSLKHISISISITNKKENQ